MLVSLRHRTGDIWTVAGTGAPAPTIQNALNLTDGRPDTPASLAWFGGTQNTASIFRLRANWRASSAAIVPGLIGLSNLSLPIGTKVSVAFTRTTDGAGTFPYVPAQLVNNGQRIVAGPRGEQTCWIWITPGASLCDGCEIQIYNDVNGVASIPALQAFTLGEAWIGECNEIDVDDSWHDTRIDPATVNYSWSRQPYTSPGVVYRQLSFDLPVDDQTLFLGDPATPAVRDYEQLFAYLDRGQSGVYIPRYRDSNAAFSAQYLHRTARIGICTKLPDFSHESGPNFSGKGVTVIESPIPR